MSASYEPYGERDSTVAEKLLATAKRNPEGALLVAAGVCLMMRGMGRKGLWRSSQSLLGGAGGYPASTAGNGHGVGESGGMMDKARDGASELGGRIRQSAEEIAGYADHMRRAAVDTSSRIAGQTASTVQSGVGRVIEEQPLALALLGLAAGAAVAALIPPTRIEERTLGPIGERITEEAEEAGRRLTQSATEAGKRLATEGLSEAARHVARSFTEADRDLEEQAASRTSQPAVSRPASSASTGSSGGGAASRTGSTSAASATGRSDEDGARKSESGAPFGSGSSETRRDR
jgi:hypothetical protein